MRDRPFPVESYVRPFKRYDYKSIDVNELFAVFLPVQVSYLSGTDRTFSRRRQPTWNGFLPFDVRRRRIDL